jgi:hypothetical protein
MNCSSVYTGVEYLSKAWYGGNLSSSYKSEEIMMTEFEVLAENTIGIPNYEITNLFWRVEAQIVEALVLFVDTQTQRQKT